MQRCVTDIIMYFVLPLQCKFLLWVNSNLKEKKLNLVKTLFLVYVLLLSNVMF